MLALASVLVAVLTLTRDIFDWQVDPKTPSSPEASSPPNSPGPPVDPVPPTTGPTQRATAGTGVRTHLDTLRVEAGEANLSPLPRSLDGQPGYERPVVIKCPSNAGADRQREVTYRLQRRYLDFTALVRPYFPASDDHDSTVHVYALLATRAPDDTINRTTSAELFDARMAEPKSLSASVEGADELILRVRCQMPNGYVVFANGSLKPS
ncbi:hypothetical protein I0C86_36990 [Plantactinospora sp. S1510]|uniref:Uncharacterized protein n=1 Tax=Plantactinospora alkalitolerans TaxID=2789879 RepID=A0ABS0H8S2_9ACTN|nr:hypothetical protein [Plantactinospora alkalitolerans]MBF9134487.1 hypothetical protein [Plantactinospora alkalitolerans]